MFLITSVMAFAQKPNNEQTPEPDVLSNKIDFFGKERAVVMGDIPAGRLRGQLEKLHVAARDNALKNLEKHKIPKADLASVNADRRGELYYSCAIGTPCAGCADHAGHAEVKPGPEVQGAEPVQSTPETQFIPAGSTGVPFTPSAPVNIASPPIFHSLPGATKVLFLDFNGHTITKTQWNTTAAPTYACLPYDKDGDSTTFSVAEQQLIYDAWKRVAEDFAPFNVNVTTEQPAQWTRTTGHALITPEVDANGVNLPHKSLGGIAYLDVFNDASYSYNYTSGDCTSPVWVQPYGDVGSGNAGNLALVISHELGHNFGLSHHGFGAAEYYGGHEGTTEATSWGPIMGTAYSSNLSQWTKGEYFNATNAGQDDCWYMQTRLGYRADDHGNDVTTPTPLTLNGMQFSAQGMISEPLDTDAFVISSGGGTLSITVQPEVSVAGSLGANLDAQLVVYDQSGAVIASSNPPTQVSASISITVPAGLYYAYITPVGAGSPMANPPSGYSVYGSRGTYVISGTSTAPGNETAPAISVHPVAKIIGLGQSHALSVAAGGGGLKYQWRKNGTPISGAGFSTLRFDSASIADTGSYDVVVSNSFGSVTSGSAQLTVVSQKVNAGPDQYVFLTGGEAWTPADLSAHAWYDASHATSITAPTGTVSAWRDRRGAGYEVREISQITSANQPAFANGTISFDGSNDHLWSSSPFMYDNGQIDVFIVGSVLSTQLDKRLLSEGHSTNIQVIYALAQTLNGGDGSQMNAFVRNSSGTVLRGHGALSGSGAFNSTRRIYQWRDTGSSLSGRVNGGSANSTNYTRSGTMAANRFTVGALINSSVNSYAQAGINEIVITNNLSDIERQKLEGYLAHKWNLVENLPSGHPYRGAPPVKNATATAILDGTVLAPENGSLTSTWSRVDGPDVVNFTNPSAADTTATITTEGTYTVRLSASNGSEYYQDECVLRVIPFTETYTVSYNGNGHGAGSAPSEQTKIKGIDLTLSGNTGNLTKFGHTLTGWNTAANGSGTQYALGGTYAVESGATLYATWTPNAYTVTFRSNNGNIPSPTTKVVNFDSAYGTLSNVTRTGHTFNGWFTAASGGTEVTSATLVTATADHELFAQWTIQTYTVSYNGNNNTSGAAPSDQTKTYNVSLALATNSGNLQRTGYLFDGWNIAANGTGTNYAEGANYTTNSALSLYAKWVKQSTITFHKQGGTGGSGSVLATTNSPMPAATAPTRSGYNFAGYYTAPSGGGTQYYTSTMASARNWDIETDTTLYAHWIADPTAPTVTSFSPTDNATNVIISTDLVVTFSEPVAFGGGAITIRSSLNGSVIETYDVANPGANLTISGAVLTINPTVNLPHSAAFYVNIAPGAIRDIAENAYAGITNSSTWNFTTAKEILLADIFTGSTATAINDNLTTRQSGTMAVSNYTVEAGSDQKMSSSKLKTVSGQRVVNNADFESALTSSGLLGFTLSFKIENDGTSWISSSLSTHNLNGTDDRGESRFGLHLWNNGNGTAITAYGNSGSGQSSHNLSKTTLDGLLGSSFTASNLNTFTMVATPTSTTAGTYDLFVNGVEALSDIPYLIGTGGSNGKVSWESHNSSGTCYIDDLSISRSPNRAPVWTISPSIGTDATEGQVYSGTLSGSATDLDGQALTFAKVSGPAWLQVAGNGTLSGTPGSSDVTTLPNSFVVSVSDGVAAAVQVTLKITVLSKFEQWTSGGTGGEGITFNGDSNADGIPDGLAWLLGAQAPADNANALLPPADENNENLVVGFKVLNSGNRGSSSLKLQYSKDLGVGAEWTEVAIPETSGTVGLVQFTITPNGAYNQVQAMIPSIVAEGGGKIFMRLKAE